MVDLNGLDWWADCIQTAPNPLKPDSVYAVCGPEILDLPEGRGAPQLLGTLSALGEIHVCVLQHFQPAIIVTSENQLTPEVLKRIAGEEWLIHTYGPDWWIHPKRSFIEKEISFQAMRQGELLKKIAELRASYPVELVEERFVKIFEPHLKADIDETGHGEQLKPVGFYDLMNMQFPEPQYLVKPWLNAPGLAMIFAERGVGKSLFACSLAHAVATGREFMVWN